MHWVVKTGDFPVEVMRSSVMRDVAVKHMFLSKGNSRPCFVIRRLWNRRKVAWLGLLEAVREDSTGMLHSKMTGSGHRCPGEC